MRLGEGCVRRGHVNQSPRFTWYSRRRVSLFLYLLPGLLEWVSHGNGHHCINEHRSVGK